MSRYRLYPVAEQAALLLEHCAHARYVWNLAVEQHQHWHPGRANAPGLAEQCRQLTEARRENDWLRAGSVNVQQQALRDFACAKAAFFKSGFGHPVWRTKRWVEGFRITDKCEVRKLNRRWAQVWVPKIGWVRFRLTTALPVAKSYRITLRNGQWHVAFAIKPEPIPGPGTGEVVGMDRGVVITAALSNGHVLNCPKLTSRERARMRKHQRRAARALKGTPEKDAEYAAIVRLRARETARRKDWCEKTSTDLARRFDVIRVEDLRIKNMTARPAPKPDPDRPGTFLPNGAAAKGALNRAILAQGWGMLVRRMEDKAPGRVERVRAAYTSLRCSDCGWIDKNSRESQAVFCCTNCGFTCNADINAAVNIAAGHAGGAPSRVREPTASAALVALRESRPQGPGGCQHTGRPRHPSISPTFN